MNPDHETAHSEFSKANKASRESYLAWVRTVLTVITGTLVLLIGLQDSGGLSKPAVVLIVAAIITMTITILSGLSILRSESIAYRGLRDVIGTDWNDRGRYNDPEYELPSYYKVVNFVFKLSALISIILVSLYGISKFAT